MFILDFIGSLFGYIIDFFYQLLPNYGVALILFTLFTKILLFPLSVRQQKSMAVQARLASKQKELQAKHRDNKELYQQELMRLYDKEGVSSTSGCLPMLIQMPVLFGLFYSVSRPLTNVLHMAADKIAQVETLLPAGTTGGAYVQITIIREFEAIKASLSSVLTGGEIAQIESFAKGFNFLGLDLLGQPSFTSWLLLIPLFCFITSVGSTTFTTLLQGRKFGASVLVTSVLMSSITTWFAFVVPAAVGLYWIFSNLFGFAQSYVMNLFYNPRSLSAQEEAARIARRISEEEVELQKAAKNPKVYVPAPAAIGASASAVPKKTSSGKPSGKSKKKR